MTSVNNCIAHPYN